jgi:hypothetical protein
MANTPNPVREHLKILLYQLAKNSDTPGADLHELLQEVIAELYEEAKQVYGEKKTLKLIVANEF